MLYMYENKLGQCCPQKRSLEADDVMDGLAKNATWSPQNIHEYREPASTMPKYNRMIQRIPGSCKWYLSWGLYILGGMVAGLSGTEALSHSMDIDAPWPNC